MAPSSGRLFGPAPFLVCILAFAGTGLAERIEEDDEDRGAGFPQYITALGRRTPLAPLFSLLEGASPVEADLEARILRHGAELEARQTRFRSGARVGTGSTTQKTVQAVPRTALADLDFTEYIGPIGVGTKARPKGCFSPSLLANLGRRRASCRVKEQQKLKVVFDTGSTNLWIASTRCTSGPCMLAGRHRFNSKESETFMEPEVPQTLDVEFGTANLTGSVGMDSFHIGPFTVRNQTFALISQEFGGTFAELPLEGIVGLGFPSLMDKYSSQGKLEEPLPFFDNVIKQKVLKKNMFAFYLAPPEEDDADTAYSKNSDVAARAPEYHLGMDAILWGGVDDRLHEGQLMWFPVTQAHYWAIDLHGFFIGDVRVELAGDTSAASFTQRIVDSLFGHGEDENSGKGAGKLIVDSGTTYYTAESAVYDIIMSKVGCDRSGSLGPLALPNLTYRMKDVAGKMRSLVLSPKDYMVSECEPGFLKIDIPRGYGPAMLLGEIFMRKYLTVFDRGDGTDGNARIGFAKAKRVQQIRSSIALD